RRRFDQTEKDEATAEDAGWVLAPSACPSDAGAHMELEASCSFWHCSSGGHFYSSASSKRPAAPQAARSLGLSDSRRAPAHRRTSPAPPPPPGRLRRAGSGAEDAAPA